MRYDGLNIERLNHDCFQITGSKIIYTDPFKIGGGPQADLILVSHEHFDHFSPDDIRKITGAKTAFVAGEFVNTQIPADLNFEIRHFLAAGHSVEIDGVIIKAVAAYNTNKLAKST
jgi:L-ascorbate metabolism protein UlaG (beta-lactamase superfamily)